MIPDNEFSNDMESMPSGDQMLHRILNPECQEYPDSAKAQLNYWLNRSNKQGETAMRVNELLPSKFLKQSDVGAGILVTFKSISKENVGKEDDPEYKYAAHFVEQPKPLILNKTNIKRLSSIFGSEETDQWVGKQCVIYFDPDVEFAGEQVGGLRVRAMKSQTPEKEILPF